MSVESMVWNDQKVCLEWFENMNWCGLSVKLLTQYRNNCLVIHSVFCALVGERLQNGCRMI